MSWIFMENELRRLESERDGLLIRSKSKNGEDDHFSKQTNLPFPVSPNSIRRSLLARMRMAALICQSGNTSYAPYGFYLPLSSSLNILFEIN